MARLALVPIGELVEHAEALRKVLQYGSAIAAPGTSESEKRYRVLDDVRKSLVKIESHLKGAGYVTGK